MPRKVIPFTHDFARDENDQKIPIGLFHQSTVKITELYNLNGEKFDNEKNISPGEEFYYHYQGPLQVKGVFVDAMKTFEAELKIVDFAISTKNGFLLKDVEENVHYVMYPNDLLDLIKKSKLDEGVVHGTFGFVSKGSATGLKLIG